MKLEKLPCFPLAFLPTPVAEMKRLRQHLASRDVLSNNKHGRANLAPTAFPEIPQLFIKRDDMTGLAFGGNKTRKLQFLIGDAVEQKCDSVVTGGAAQSNHCRQTAAAAAVAGLECHLVLGGSEPQEYTGNLLLDRILGANIHWNGELRKGERIPEIADTLRSQGKRPYVIPYGGSNHIGAVGYVDAMLEFAAQMKRQKLNITHIVFASSSCGTQAGMALGARLFAPSVKIVGIRIDKDETELTFEEQMVKLANETADHLEVSEKFTLDDFIIRDQYLGGGYGVVGDLERHATATLGRTEGIILDPVYTSRAFGALLDMIESGYFSKDDRVLFWHTGGGPGVFGGTI